MSSEPIDLYVLILKMTEWCNSHCRYCTYWETGSKSFLSLRDILKIISSLDSNIPPYTILTGGEPLLVPDITIVMKNLYKSGTLTSVCTNGILIERFIEPICTFLDEIFISFWGGSQFVHDSLRGTACFQKTVSGISQLASQKKRPQIILRMTVCKENIHELKLFAELGVRLKVDGISIQPLDRRKNTFGQNEIAPFSRSKEEEEGIERAFQEFQKKTRCLGNLIQKESDVNRVRDYLLERPVSQLCNVQKRSLVVEPDMSLSYCYFQKSHRRLTKESNLASLLTGMRKDTLPNIKLCSTCICPRIYP